MGRLIVTGLTSKESTDLSALTGRGGEESPLAWKLGLKGQLAAQFSPFLLLQTLRRILGIEGNKESLGVGMGTRLLAGGGAGITAASLTYPLDLVRTRLAAQVRSLHFVMFKVKF